jgi:hypothetical protein
MTRRSLSDITGPEPGAAEIPARAEPADARAAARRKRAAPAGNGRAAAAPAADAAMDAATLNRWRWQLGATARKVTAARARADAALAGWDQLAADAAAAGVPARLVVAAAADAGLDTPGG